MYTTRVGTKINVIIVPYLRILRFMTISLNNDTVSSYVFIGSVIGIGQYRASSLLRSNV